MMYEKEFKDKVVVITGAAHGIGKVTAEEFKKYGAKVCIIDVMENDYFVGDLSKKEDIDKKEIIIGWLLKQISSKSNLFLHQAIDEKTINTNEGYSEIKAIGNETSIGKAQSDIVNDIQIYNTLDVSFWNNQYLVITVYTNAQPVVYYFKNEYSKEDISEIIEHIKEFCSENDIDFREFENQNP